MNLQFRPVLLQIGLIRIFLHVLIAPVKNI